MRNNVLVTADILVLMVALPAWATAPEVTNVRARQRPDSFKLIDITYDPTNGDGIPDADDASPNTPTAATVDAGGCGVGLAGRLLVSSANSRAVLRYAGPLESNAGEYLDTLVDVGPSAAYHFVFGPNCMMYLGGGDGGGVLRYDLSQAILESGFVPPGSYGLEAPKGITLGPDGNVYVTNALSGETERGVLRFNALTGTPMPGPLCDQDTAFFVCPGPDVPSHPNDLVFRSDGFLYVCGGPNYNPGIVARFDATTGSFEGTFVVTSSVAEGMSFDADGNLYVVSYFANAVERYTPNGLPFPSTSCDPASPYFVCPGGGGLQSPRGKAVVGPDGSLYVGNPNANAVNRYDGVSGAFLGVFATVSGPRTVMFVQADLNDGLVGYWSFDDGTAHDYSGNGHDGQVYGASPTVGVSGGAFEFDGLSHIDSTFAPTLQPEDSLSIAVWAKMPSQIPTESWPRLVGLESHPVEWSFRIRAIDGKVEFYFVDDQPAYRTLTSVANLCDGSWHHFVGIREGSGGTIRFYVDAVLQDHVGDTSGTFNTQSQFSFYFGAHHHDVGAIGFFNGVLDEIRAYDRPLTPGEIVLLAAQPLGACCHLDGVCEDSVAELDCSGADGTWTQGTLCMHLDPPCQSPDVLLSISPLVLDSAAGWELGNDTETDTRTNAIVHGTDTVPPPSAFDTWDVGARTLSPSEIGELNRDYAGQYSFLDHAAFGGDGSYWERLHEWRSAEREQRLSTTLTGSFRLNWPVSELRQVSVRLAVDGRAVGRGYDLFNNLGTTVRTIVESAVGKAAYVVDCVEGVMNSELAADGLEPGQDWETLLTTYENHLNATGESSFKAGYEGRLLVDAGAIGEGAPGTFVEVAPARASAAFGEWTNTLLGQRRGIDGTVTGPSAPLLTVATNEDVPFRIELNTTAMTQGNFATAASIIRQVSFTVTDPTDPYDSASQRTWYMDDESLYPQLYRDLDSNFWLREGGELVSELVLGALDLLHVVVFQACSITFDDFAEIATFQPLDFLADFLEAEGFLADRDGVLLRTGPAAAALDAGGDSANGRGPSVTAGSPSFHSQAFSVPQDASELVIDYALLSTTEIAAVGELILFVWWETDLGSLDLLVQDFADVVFVPIDPADAFTFYSEPLQFRYDLSTLEPNAGILGVLLVPGDDTVHEGAVIIDGMYTTSSLTWPTDFDGDRDVDVEDHTMFVGCMTGPSSGELGQECEDMDIDGDRDVDIDDFSRFQRCYSGRGRASDPHCAD